MARQRPGERHVRLCGQYAEQLLPVLRARARDLGYAIGVHGSLARDIDLIAVPWTTEAVDAPQLAEALRVAAETVCPIAINTDAEGAANPAYFHDGEPGAKPHGRRTWAYQLGGGPYIDLSVMPRLGGDCYEPPVIYPDKPEADMTDPDDLLGNVARAARDDAKALAAMAEHILTVRLRDLRHAQQHGEAECADHRKQPSESFSANSVRT